MASNRNQGQEFADLQSQAQQVLSNRSNELENQLIIQRESQSEDVNLQGALQMTADPASGTVAPTPVARQATVPASQAGLRPETQAVLQQYGVNASVTERSSRMSSNNTTKSTKSTTTSQSAGSTKVTNTTTVNNITNNNTTTTTNVESNAQPQRVVQAPVVPTAVAANPSQTAVAKQQVMMNTYLRRKAATDAQRDKEYRRRDRDLKREQSSLFEKLKNFTASTYNSLNPDNMSTVNGTMNFWKWMIGSYLVGKYFHPMLGFLERTYKYISGKDPNNNLRKDATDIFTGFRDAMSEVMNEFIANRKAAIDAVGPYPGDKNWKDIFSLGEVLEWIGRVVMAGLGGTGYISRSANRKAIDRTDELAKENGATTTIKEGRKTLETSLESEDSKVADGSSLTDTVSKGKSGDKATDLPLTEIMETNTRLLDANSQKAVSIDNDYLRTIGISAQKLGENGLLATSNGTPISAEDWNRYKEYVLSARGMNPWEILNSSHGAKSLAKTGETKEGKEYDERLLDLIFKIYRGVIGYKSGGGQAASKFELYTGPITLAKDALSSIMTSTNQFLLSKNEGGGKNDQAHTHLFTTNDSEGSKSKGLEKMMVNAHGVIDDSTWFSDSTWTKLQDKNITKDQIIKNYGSNNLSTQSLNAFRTHESAPKVTFEPVKKWIGKTGEILGWEYLNGKYNKIYSDIERSGVGQFIAKKYNDIIESWKGRRYSNDTNRDGSRNDCSGFTRDFYNKLIGRDIGYNSDSQWNGSNGIIVDRSDVDINGQGKGRLPDESRLEPGDLLYYACNSDSEHGQACGSRKYHVGHVEMYIGNGKMIGMRSKLHFGEVPITRYSTQNYAKYLGAKRFIDSKGNLLVSESSVIPTEEMLNEVLPSSTKSSGINLTGNASVGSDAASGTVSADEIGEVAAKSTNSTSSETSEYFTTPWSRSYSLNPNYSVNPNWFSPQLGATYTPSYTPSTITPTAKAVESESKSNVSLLTAEEYAEGVGLTITGFNNAIAQQSQILAQVVASSGGTTNITNNTTTVKSDNINMA